MSGAGCMFTDGRIVLAGFHPKLGKISGFGGMKIDDETPHQTAMRETLEELFGFKDIPHDIIARMPVVDRHIAYPSYTCFLYSFDDLDTILRRAKRYFDSSSPYYPEFPTNLSELILKRTYENETMEVTELFLISTNTDVRMSRSFQKDLNAVSENYGDS
jgi:hypothetical protein